jgi:RND family efflux transporter MFP subunit
MAAWALAAAAAPVRAAEPAHGQDAHATSGGGTGFQPVNVENFTKPSANVLLSFVRSGNIAQVLVKEGDAVESGQVLARLDDEAERLQVEQLEADAENGTPVENAEVQLAQKEADLKKRQWALSHGASTVSEVEQARVEVQFHRLAVEVARFDQSQKRRQYEEAKVELDRMRIVSPTAGRVEEAAIEPGEAAEPLRPVLRIVRIDPLWVEASVPLEQAAAVRVGQAARVEFPAAHPATPACASHADRGRIVWVAAVADAASRTLQVRVEVPNPAGRPAGERVRVVFLPVRDQGAGDHSRNSELGSRNPELASGARPGAGRWPLAFRVPRSAFRRGPHGKTRDERNHEWLNEPTAHPKAKSPSSSRPASRPASAKSASPLTNAR